jgi:hypothetical protein
MLADNQERRTRRQRDIAVEMRRSASYYAPACMFTDPPRRGVAIANGL